MPGGMQATITEAGRATIEAARPVHPEAVRRYLADVVPPAQLSDFVDVLGHLSARAR